MSFSQTISENDSIVPITSDQLLKANLIFIEHKYLLEQNSLLNKQIVNYKKYVNLLEQTDSIRIKEIELRNTSYNTEIERLNDEIKIKNNTILYWKIGGICVSACLLIWLIIK